MGGKIKSAFRGMWYGARAAFAFANGAVRRVGLAWYAVLALVVVAFAVVMYASPYLLDAVRCVTEVEHPLNKCLGETYDEARQDTNLAAIIIALAITLAALRPGQDAS